MAAAGCPIPACQAARCAVDGAGVGSTTCDGSGCAAWPKAGIAGRGARGESRPASPEEAEEAEGESALKFLDLKAGIWYKHPLRSLRSLSSLFPFPFSLSPFPFFFPLAPTPYNFASF